VVKYEIDIKKDIPNKPKKPKFINFKFKILLNKKPYPNKQKDIK
tara:strand:+ start:113 stop:244 length:132 start_codon:yes stop_codon:yes gene_type:complete